MYFVGHDLGTGSNKAVLVDATGAVLGEHVEPYGLSHPQPGWAEQDPEDFWRAVCACTRAVVAQAGVSAADVKGLAFAGQMLCLLPLDAQGIPTRKAISWLDARADAQARRMVRRLGGETLLHLLAGASPTGKDLVAKVAWIREHEPEVFARTHAFVDATSYLVARATGRIALDPTAAGGFGTLDLGTRTWSRLLSWLVSLPLERMPEILPCSAAAGTLTPSAAEALGLTPRTVVAMGMADIPSAAVGSGALAPGDAHVYLGTSSWIGASSVKPRHVPRAGIASVPSPDPDAQLVIGESETAGACRQWFLSRIGVEHEDVDAGFESLVASSEPGAGGLLFFPWLFGERSPVPDTGVRGAFVNLSLEHTRADMARSVYEGVALNLRWILDAIAGSGEPCPSLRAIGGGARSDAWLQILADVTARPVTRVASPQHAGAVGSALVSAVATGALPSVRAIRETVRTERTFEPRVAFAARYAEALSVYRALHPALSQAGGRLVPRGSHP